MPNTNTNNCTKRNPEEVTSTKIATGAKTIQEILNMASDMVPGASGQTFIKMVDSLKDLDANVAVYIAEMQNKNSDRSINKNRGRRESSKKARRRSQSQRKGMDDNRRRKSVETNLCILQGHHIISIYKSNQEHGCSNHGSFHC